MTFHSSPVLLSFPTFTFLLFPHAQVLWTCMAVTNSSVATHLPKQLLLDTHNALVSETIPMQVASGRFGKLNVTVSYLLPAWLVTIITNNPTPTFPGLPPGLLVAECLYVLATRQAHILFRNNYDVCVRVVMTSTETHPFVTANTLWWQFTLHTRYQLVDCFSAIYCPRQRPRRQLSEFTIVWHGGAWHEHEQWVVKCGLPLRSNEMYKVRPQLRFCINSAEMHQGLDCQ